MNFAGLFIFVVIDLNFVIPSFGNGMKIVEGEELKYKNYNVTYFLYGSEIRSLTLSKVY
jgi:hypothetical protein